MTETESPATQPLTSYLSKVKVTEGQAIALLSSIANANFDKDPTLYSALNDAISSLSAPAEDSTTKPTDDPTTSSTEPPPVEGPTPPAF